MSLVPRTIFKTEILEGRVKPHLAGQGFHQLTSNVYYAQSSSDAHVTLLVESVLGRSSSSRRLRYTFDVGVRYARLDVELARTGEATALGPCHMRLRSTDSPRAQASGDFERASWYYFSPGQDEDNGCEWSLAVEDLTWALAQLEPLASEAAAYQFWHSGQYLGQTEAERRSYEAGLARLLRGPG